MAAGKVILTAFNPFGGRADNPSQEIVEAVREAEGDATWLVTEVLRTEFAYAGSRIRELIATHGPAAVLMLGLSDRAPCLRIERRAVNCVAARIADNAGEQPPSGVVVGDGPDVYPATLPTDAMGAALTAMGIPWEFSDDAGTFVCNYTFYCAADELVRRSAGARCGFVHVPDRTVLGLEDAVAAVRACLRVMRDAPSVIV